VVAQTEPALAMDWAVYISFAGNALPILATAPLAQATWWATGGGLNDLNEKVLKERAARIKQYREDLTNSTYERESYPIDNAPGGARGVGWTKEVLTVPANPLFELASGDGKVLNPHTELIVNGGKKSDQGVEGRNSRMSGTSTSLIPSKGALVGIGKTPTGADTMSATSFGGSQTLKGFETTSSLAKITQLKDSVPPCESPLFGMREEMMEADNAQMRQTRLGGGVLLPKPDADVGMERSPAHLKMSSTMAMLPDEFGNTAPIEVFGETAPIDSVKAVERKRNVTRVPVADRPDIEGFVDSSNTRKKKNDRDKFSYETQKVVVNNTTR